MQPGLSFFPLLAHGCSTFPRCLGRQLLEAKKHNKPPLQKSTRTCRTSAEHVETVDSSLLTLSDAITLTLVCSEAESAAAV